jgi:ferrochelatase
MSKTGVLLINLGTPCSPTLLSVYNYLTEFLLDYRVIDMPWLIRQFLVRGLIVPLRVISSTRSYKSIWTPEGAPLLMYGNRARTLLQESLGPDYVVALAMRYQTPSLASALDLLLKQNIDELKIIPLFPQYASATTGSIFQEVFARLSKYLIIPRLTFIDQFSDHPKLIQAFKQLALPLKPETHDHILISFHGLPERHIRKADRGGQCLTHADCCSLKNVSCYRAQCYATAKALVNALNLTSDQYSVSFQSRLGKDPWLTPYTSDVLTQLAQTGRKKVLVFCPSFVSDCLETTYEIGTEYKHLFLNAGGQTLTLVPGLNDHPAFIQTLKDLVLS